MKRIRIGFACAVLSMVAISPAVLASGKSNPPAHRISIEKAREVARRAYAGQIQGEELEFEGGKWIYSFDLKNSNDNQVHEVHVDAVSGKLLDVHTESTSDEQKERDLEKSHLEHE